MTLRYDRGAGSVGTGASRSPRGTSARGSATALLDKLFTVSMRLLRGLGLRQEAHFRESLFWKGEWVDDVIFAVLRSEWQERLFSGRR